MFNCPYCNCKGIGFWSKIWSGSDTPSKCRLCGNLSYVHSKYRFGFQTAWPTVFKIAGYAASIYIFYISNVFEYLLLIPLFWGIGSLWELASLPMSKITSEESQERRKFGNTFILLVVVICILLLVTTRGG